MLRDWLKIARSQTAPAVIMLCGIFFLLGGGNLFSWYGLALIVFSILIHDFSFAHNSVIDVLAGYDTNDLHKKHFPLCKGSFNTLFALKIVHIGAFFCTLFAIALAFYGPGHPFLAVSCYAVFLIGWFWYNEWTSKIVIWDFLPISICFTALALFAYFLSATSVNMIVVLAALYLFMVEWHQTSVNGEIKDLNLDKEVSLLRLLGANCTHIFDLGPKAFLYSWTIKLTKLLLLVAIVFICNFTWVAVFFLCLAIVALIYLGVKLTKRQKWERNRALRYMAAEEMISIFILPLVLIPLLDIFAVIFLILFALLYFFLMNKINWNTWLRPQV